MDSDKIEKNAEKSETIQNISPDETNVDDESDDDIPDGVKEILSQIPELPGTAKSKISKFMLKSTEMGIMGHLNQESAIFKKITPEHINEYLSASRENMTKGFQERRENKIYTFALVLVALIFFVVLIFLLKSNPDLLERIVYSVVGLVAGAFGGYGVGRHKRNQDDDD